MVEGPSAGIADKTLLIPYLTFRVITAATRGAVGVQVAPVIPIALSANARSAAKRDAPLGVRPVISRDPRESASAGARVRAVSPRPTSSGWRAGRACGRRWLGVQS